ncbi:hypothetical protein DFH06DRAFT_1229456 [Mycena polygramma]|nr:hypothetical protein DFH06DRAFT_1229456 [Mycena polygramma]
MSSLHPVLNRWLPPPVMPIVHFHTESVAFPKFPQITDARLFDLPNEIWAHIFQDSSLGRRDLYAVFTSCHHFNALVFPILLCNFSGTNALGLAAGEVDIPSDMVHILNLAIHLPSISRFKLTFDIRGDSKAPREFRALRTLLRRAPAFTDLRLHFLGDLLSAYKSDLVPLCPQRLITDAFCEFLSSIPHDPDGPVVFVGTEIFTCRAADIRDWRLDKYLFTDTGATRGLSGLLSGIQAYMKPPIKNPLRTKTTIKQHNGLHTAVFSFISIPSAHIKRLHGFSTAFSPWTLVVLNPGSSQWPNALNLSSPLASQEWAAILPRLTFLRLPLIRMDPPGGNLSSMPNIPAPVLDAFLARHPNITRMHYYPDPLTLPDAPPFPSNSMPYIRNITTTARGALHLLHRPEDAFPNLFIIRINGADEPHLIAPALRLLARLGGSRKILEVASGSWMAVADPADADVVRGLHRVDTVILSGFTDFVDPGVILSWLCLFPALRRVGLQGCVHDDAGQKEQKDFTRRTREVLPDSVELIST